MFEVIALPSEIIFKLLTITYRDVEKEMLHVVAWPFLYIFCVLPSPKWLLGQVGKAMICVAPIPCKEIFCLLGGQKCDYVDFEKVFVHGDD
jgi:hypothetical protein